MSFAVAGYVALAAFSAGLAAGGGAIWYVRGVEVGREENKVAACRLEGEQLKGHVADRDRTIGEQRRSNRMLLDSVGRQTAALEGLTKAAADRQDAAAAALATARQALGSTRLSIDALTARIDTRAPSDCSPAMREWRAEGH